MVATRERHNSRPQPSARCTATASLTPGFYRCGHTVQRSRATAQPHCPCVFHALELELDADLRRAPCGHPVDRVPPQPVHDADLAEQAPQPDRDRWCRSLEASLRRMTPEQLRALAARESLPVGFDAKSRGGAAYQGLWLALGAKQFEAWFRQLLTRLLAEVDAVAEQEARLERQMGEVTV